MKLSYNKLCNLEDFEDPELRSVIRRVFEHEIARFGEHFPAGVEYRKHWEVAMAVRTLQECSRFSGSEKVLGVGAGSEPTIFYLTNLCTVIATDLYLDAGEWGQSASEAMMTNPGRYWPAFWNRGRLVVQHMDARDLQFADESFEGIFSSSSIEHFGGFEDVRRAVSEMYRVLRRGGVLSLSTEFRLEGPPHGLPGILMFDVDELREIFLKGRGWSLLSPLDLNLSSPTRLSESAFADCLTDLNKHVTENNDILFHRLRWSHYPQILLRNDDFLWTSVHLALRKD